MRKAVEAALQAWHELVCRYAFTVVFTATLAAGLSAYYVVENLGINTDTGDLLSEKLPWRATYLEYTTAFPQYADDIVVVIEGETPDQIHDAIPLLAARIGENPEVFESVFLGGDSDFFRTNGLLFLETEELEELADRLAEVQPFLARLAGDPSLSAFADLLTQTVEEITSGQSLPVDATFDAVADVISAAHNGKRKNLSWQTLMSTEPVSDADRRAIIVVKPVLDFSLLLPGERAVQALRQLVVDANLTPDNGIRVRLTGGAALAYEELDSVTRGAQRAGLLALVMVSIVLAVGLRSVILVLATLLTLIFGLLYTAAFATFAIGELNMISVAFAVLYIGLGVDFAIHYCLRYQELSGDHGNGGNALALTSRDVGSSLAVCAVTTATGFFAFLPTAYSGVAELGAISGTGMFVSLLVSLSLLPALLSIAPKVTTPRHKVGPANAFATLPQRIPGKICVLAGAFGIAAIALLPSAEFDHNPIHLQDPTTESVITYRELLEQTDRSPLSIVAMVEGSVAAETLSTRLKQLPSVDTVITVETFLAAGQDEKLEIIEDIALTLGPDLEVDENNTAGDSKAALEGLQRLRERLLAYSKNLATDSVPTKTEASADRLLSALDTYLKKLGELALTQSPGPGPGESNGNGNNQSDDQPLIRLENALLVNLPGRLDALRQSLEAESFDAQTLPRDLFARWVSTSGSYRIEVLPRENLDDNRALEAFVAEAREVLPVKATGNAVINVEASAAVVSAFQQAFASAILIISILLLFLLERRRDVLFVLTPLLLAGLLTAATVVMLGESFNFANIIALPLLLGIGVDSAIHILHRHRSSPPTDGTLLSTSTARAVVVSAFTTACGFGNLAVSTHIGTASLGKLLAYGLCYMLICTLLLLPSMLTLADRKRA
jgi:hopanoid biosynthesis associated RND transporter like protein HpnN